MMHNTRRGFTLSLLLASSTLSACSVLPEWIGGDDGKPKITGERIAVLKTDNKLKPDPRLTDYSILLPAPVENQEWPMSSGIAATLDPHLALPKSLAVQKKIDIGKGGTKEEILSITPVISGDRILTLDRKGTLTARSIADISKILWKTTIELPIKHVDFLYGGMLATPTTLFVTSGANFVIAVDMNTGAIQWKKSIAGIARSAPAIAGDRIFVNTMENTLYALDVKEGNVLWTRPGPTEEIGLRGTAAPIATNEMVFVPQSSGDLVALSIFDGSEAWNESLNQRINQTPGTILDIDVTPVLANGKIIASSESRLLAALDALSGIRLWEHEVSLASSPWNEGEYIFLATTNAEIMAIHAASGAIKWVTPLPAYENQEKKKDPIAWHGPVLAGDRVWMVSTHGSLIALNPETGAAEGEISVPNEIRIPPIVSHNHLFLLTNGGTLVMLGEEKNSALKPIKFTVLEPKDATDKKEKSEDATKDTRIVPEAAAQDKTPKTKEGVFDTIKGWWSK